MHPHSILPRSSSPVSHARLEAWLRVRGVLRDWSQGEWGSTNEEEPTLLWSNIGAGGEEHLYYRSHLQARRSQETPQEPRSYFSSWFWFLKRKPATNPPSFLLPPPQITSDFFFHSKCLVWQLFFPEAFLFFRKQPKRSRTRTTENNPPSLLQSWCRWTASNLSVCTRSCTSPNTRLCTPALRPSAEPVCQHHRWVQNSVQTSTFCSSCHVAKVQHLWVKW